MTQVCPGLGEAPVPALVSMICSPDGVVMAFPVWARVGVAIAAPPGDDRSFKHGGTARAHWHCVASLRARETRAFHGLMESGGIPLGDGL